MNLVKTAAAVAAGVLGLTLAPAQPATSLSAPAQVAPEATSARPAPAPAGLSVSPKNFFGGQALTFRGRLPKAGQRPIRLEQHLNRPGDEWFPVEGFRGSTKPDGSFDFQFRAPSMFGISYRVRSGALKTRKVTMTAKSQDLVMWVAGDRRDDPTSTAVPVAGRPFQVVVDTTPDLRGRPDTHDLPVLEGRELTLQRRTAENEWRTIATGRADARGMGYFDGLTAPEGTTVYRVRQEDWFEGVTRIGWFPSFPTYVRVAGSSAEARRLERAAARSRTERAAVRTERTARTAAPAARGGTRATQTASQRYGWTPAMWDFGWEAGQSLTSPPSGGRDPRGYWLDWSDGTGRAAKHNGGITLDSKQVAGPGTGDRGTVRATMQGNARAYGRWETRLRLKYDRDSGRDYKILVELVPEQASQYDCGAHNITLAETWSRSSTMRFGVRDGGRTWTGERRIGDIRHTVPALAVQVTPAHITWFLNGAPVGTVRDKSAVPGMPMTLRFSIVGRGSKEMKDLMVISDWQRGFTLERGKQVTGGGTLEQDTVSGGC
ncbi:hypothetical protein GCM10023340_16210 [Nocardioides marinquilinus]|uniref:GH16 domain-containing protein n=1 Tax=Nocardioides marinquilinus TaxID=1210400 RepID=A0ABP9PFX7_9ACTN